MVCLGFVSVFALLAFLEDYVVMEQEMFIVWMHTLFVKNVTVENSKDVVMSPILIDIQILFSKL
jgi:hypothetical protein